MRLEQALDSHPNRKAYKGEILGERDGVVLLKDEDVGKVDLPLSRIARASLVYEPAPKVKPGKAKSGKQKPESKQKGAAPSAAATRDDEDKPRKSRGDSEQER